MRLSLLFLSVALTAASASTVARAQSQTQGAPPIYYTVDQNGVDLITGQLHIVTNEVVIGQPGAGGLSYGRVALSQGWRDLAIGGMNCTGADCLVSFGGVSEAFTVSGSVYTPVSNRGATLAATTGGFVFTSADGVVANLATVTGTNPYTANAALVTNITQPDGLVTTYHYTTVGTLTRLQSVTNNRGYQIHYRYDGVTPSNVEKVMGLNNAVAYCDPVAPNCNGVSGDWPSVTYARTTDGANGWFEYATDQSNRTTRYHFDPNYQLDAVLPPGQTANQIAVLRNANDDVTVASGAHGQWGYSYPATGTVVADGPSGEQITVIANAAAGQPQEVRRLLQSGATPVTVSRTFQYDSQQRVQFITDPELNRTEYRYDVRGNVTRTILRSKDGSSTIETSAAYPTTCSSVVTCNRPLSTTDARNKVTDYSWDPVHGGLLAITEPDPTVGADRPQTRYSFYQYNAAYWRTSAGVTTDPNPVWLPTIVSACVTGTVASGCNGTAAEILSVASYVTSGAATNLLPYRLWTGAADQSLGAAQDLTYTNNGDVATVTGPLAGQQTSYFYDAARQVTGVVGADPDGGGPRLNRALKIGYNSLGLQTQAEAGTVSGFVNPSSGFTRLQAQVTEYGAFGRALVNRQQGADGTTFAVSQVSYDVSGRPDCSAQRMNPVVWGSLPTSACTAQAPGVFGPDRIASTTYDRLSRPVSMTTGVGSGLAINESVTYTANSQVATLTDGRASTSALEYDGFDRLSRVRYPDPATGAPSTTDDELYGYDASSNPVTFTNRANQPFTTTFDALNRPTAVAAPSPMPGSAFTYDNLGRPLTASVPGLSTSMTWDALGRQATETGPIGTMTYGYDLAGRRTRQLWPDNFEVTYDWNVLGEMTFIRRSGAAIASYSHDDLGRRTAMGRANGVGTTYGYDAVSRLTAINHLGSANLSMGFSYNPAGQVVGRTLSNPAYAYALAPGTTTYTSDRLNRISSANGTAFAYDANGNLTNDGTRTYSYDAAGRLTGGGSPAGTLSYDGMGRLYTLTGTNGGRFLYDGDQAAALANASTNAIENHFVRGPGVDEIVANYPTASLSNPLFWMLDQQNSLLALTDITGATPYKNAYDEYGNPRSGNLGRFQYTGQLLMPDFGAYHYKARAYSPGLGRFLQADPAGYAAGANLYGYVGGDPVNFSDPSGLVQILSYCTAGYSYADGLNIFYMPQTCTYSDFGGGATFGGSSGGPREFGGGGQSTQCAANIATGAAVGAVAGGALTAAAGCAGGTAVTAGVGAPVACPVAGAAAYGAGATAGAGLGATIGGLSEACHGNSLRSDRANVVYRLADRQTGETLKFGITCQQPASCRYSPTQLNSWNADMFILSAHNSRLSARIEEISRCSVYTIQNGHFPPLSTRC